MPDIPFTPARVTPASAGNASPEYPHDAPLRLPEAQWRALCEAYAHPPRAYHHIGHVFDTLARFRDVANGPGWRRPAEVWAALLYHDAIYEAGRKDNERRSAELALAHFARWPAQLRAAPSADPPDVEQGAASSAPLAAFEPHRVAELIQLTARHGALDRAAVAAAIANAADLDGPDLEGPDLDDTLHMLDADMAILGADPATFAEYDRAIAEEYRGHVPGFLYRRGRKAFFRGLLARERIYLSDFFHARREAQARANLEAALHAR